MSTILKLSPWFISVTLTLVPGLALVGQSTSPSFRLENLTFNSGGALTTSTTYQLAFAVGQESVAFASSSPTYTSQTGFWGYYGVGRVPIWLFMKKNTTTAANLDLAWSGDETPYMLFRNTNCTSVFSRFLTSQAAISYTDTAVPVAPLVCYNLISTTSGALTGGGGGQKY